MVVWVDESPPAVEMFLAIVAELFRPEHKSHERFLELFIDSRASLRFRVLDLLMLWRANSRVA